MRTPKPVLQILEMMHLQARMMKKISLRCGMSWTSSEITEWIFHCKKCTEKEKKWKN